MVLSEIAAVILISVYGVRGAYRVILRRQQDVLGRWPKALLFARRFTKHVFSIGLGVLNRIPFLRKRASKLVDEAHELHYNPHPPHVVHRLSEVKRYPSRCPTAPPDAESAAVASSAASITAAEAAAHHHHHHHQSASATLPPPPPPPISPPPPVSSSSSSPSSPLSSKTSSSSSSSQALLFDKILVEKKGFSSLAGIGAAVSSSTVRPGVVIRSSKQ